MLVQSGTTKVVVASVPRYLEASLWTHPAVEQKTFVVLASKALRPTDTHMLGPVFEYLASVCARECEWETIKIPGWILGGKCNRTEYTVYPECPGEAKEHMCRHARALAEKVV